MLEQTFIHIQGIGLKTEQHIWKQGIRSWQDFLERGAVSLPPQRGAWMENEIRASLANRDNIRFFQERFPSQEMWRLYPAFASKTVFLDIETSGGYDGLDEITLIGLYDGQAAKTFINGRNLSDFETAIADYDLMVTFNGSSFDIPFIKRAFPGITLPVAHIDLRFVLARVGLKGGLKSIEKQLGIVRHEAIAGLNGFDAVLLWRDHCAGDQTALTRLVEYNTADIVHLQPLMLYGYEELKKKIFTDCR